MTATEFSAYLEQLRVAHTQLVFIPRQLINREDWDRAAGEEYVRLRGFFREANPDLPAVLQHPQVVFVGEPGMGKTVLAHASMLQFVEAGMLPIFVPLSEYRGGLRELLGVSAGPVSAVTTVDDQPVKRAYVLDGLDEVPGELVVRFLSDLGELVSQEPNANYVLTCRQALYEGLRAYVPSSFREFFPLGFETDDILDYAGKRSKRRFRLSCGPWSTSLLSKNVHSSPHEAKTWRLSWTDFWRREREWASQDSVRPFSCSAWLWNSTAATSSRWTTRFASCLSASSSRRTRRGNSLTN